MSEKTEDIMAKILNLCESNPDVALELIERTIERNPKLESDPFGKFAKAMAYGSKGLFQLSRSKPEVDFTGFDQEELRAILGVTETHLDYLEKGLQAIREMEEIHPGALKMFGTEEHRQGELKVDAMAMVLERCRPGRVQQVLGKTKLMYFGPGRVLYPSDLSKNCPEWRLSREDFWVFAKVFFSHGSIVRTAVITQRGTDSRGRKYLNCMLFARTPDNPAPGETIGETLSFQGGKYLFDDGSFDDKLPQEPKEAKRGVKEEPDRREQPKKKGLFGKLFG